MLEKLFTSGAAETTYQTHMQWAWANQHPLLYTFIKIVPSWWIVAVAVIGIKIVTDKRKGR